MNSAPDMWTHTSGNLPKTLTKDDTNCPNPHPYCWRFTNTGQSITSTLIRNASTQAFDSVQLTYSIMGVDIIDESQWCSIKYSTDSSNFINICTFTHTWNPQGGRSGWVGRTTNVPSRIPQLIIQISYVGSGHRCWFNEFTLKGILTPNPTNSPLTDAPTPPPTRAPTPPSVPPSKNPTETPTLPSMPPSKNPTETQSTANPSVFPSKYPTETPTLPSMHPSKNPTETPSTANPSVFPSKYPTETTAPTANSSVPPSKNPTETPSTANPSVPPSNNPTISTHVSLPPTVPTIIAPSSASRSSSYPTQVLTTAKPIVYTVSIKLTPSCQEAICDVISEELEEQILKAFNQDVELISMAIINGEVVVGLSADANAQLDADYIKSHIEREIEDDDRFGDVSVHSTEEEEDDASVTMKSKTKLWVTAISTVLIAICSIFCIYLCLRKRREMKAMKAVQTIASNDAKPIQAVVALGQPSNADEDDNRQESHDESESVGDGESLYDAPASDTNEGEAEEERDVESLYDVGDANTQNDNCETTGGTTKGPTMSGNSPPPYSAPSGASNVAVPSAPPDMDEGAVTTSVTND